MEQNCSSLTRGDLKQCMEYMLQEESSRDVTFYVGDEKAEIKAHKFILIARSPVFETMLSGLWKEGKDKVIDVPDADKEMFDVFLRYLYTDEIKMDDDNYLPLLKLADKYDVSSLILSCSEFLKEKITPSEIWNIFNLADTFNLHDLRSEAFKFLVQTEGCFNSNGILGIKKELLQEITASEDICVSEEKLYEVVVKWISAECQRKGIEFSPANKINVAAGVLDNIRFSVMSRAFLVQTVSMDELLSNDKIVQYMRTINNVTCTPRQGVQKKHVSLQNYIFASNTRNNVYYDVKWGENSSLYFKVNNNIWMHGIALEAPSKQQLLHVELDIKEQNANHLRSKHVTAVFGRNEQRDIYFDYPVKLKIDVIYIIQIKIFRTQDWDLSTYMTRHSETCCDATKITLLPHYTYTRCEGKYYCGAQGLISNLILSH